jgi:hypothetical protein
MGLPAILDIPDLAPKATRTRRRRGSFMSLTMGSDGIRLWFLVVDSRVRRPPLTDEQTESLMFYAGRCSGIVLHRDMAWPAPRMVDKEAVSDRAPASWRVLEDNAGPRRGLGTRRRLSCRFVVTCVIRDALDSELVLDTHTLQDSVGRARLEVDINRATFAKDAELALWDHVLDSLTTGDPDALARATLRLGEHAESLEHFSGSRELYRSSYEVALATGNVDVAASAARRAARLCGACEDGASARGWEDVAAALDEAMGK